MTRATRAVLLSLALCLAFPLAAQASCFYDLSFTLTSGGDVRIRAVSDCRFYAEEKTYLNVTSPSWSMSWDYGNVAEVYIPDQPGSQLYCAETYATYWSGGVIWLDDHVESACETF